MYGSTKIAPVASAQRLARAFARISSTRPPESLGPTENELMSESETMQHWRDLAEQLGLPPEPAERPAEPPLTPAAVPALRRARESSEESQTEAFPRPVTEGEIVENAHGAAAESPSEISVTPEEHRASRGRRRGRRGGRGAGSRTAQTATAEGAPDETPGAEVSAGAEETPEEPSSRDRSPGRGRGRSRHRRAAVEETEEPATVEDEVEEEPTPEPSADSDDEEEDLSGWSIPSWQELIDSLYRPDR
jgi:hypothetical protein